MSGPSVDSTGTDVNESDAACENFGKPGLPRHSARGGELLLVLGSDIVDAFASARMPRLCEPSGVAERILC